MENDINNPNKRLENAANGQNPRNLFSRLLELGKDKSHDAINWLIDAHKNTKEPDWNMGGLTKEELMDIVEGVTPVGAGIKASKAARNVIKNIIMKGKLKGGQMIPTQPFRQGIIGKGTPPPRGGVAKSTDVKQSYGHSNVGVSEKYLKQKSGLPKGERYGWESLDQSNLPRGVRPGPPPRVPTKWSPEAKATAASTGGLGGWTIAKMLQGLSKNNKKPYKAPGIGPRPKQR